MYLINNRVTIIGKYIRLSESTPPAVILYSENNVGADTDVPCEISGRIDTI